MARTAPLGVVAAGACVHLASALACGLYDSNATHLALQGRQALLRCRRPLLRGVFGGGLAGTAPPGVVDAGAVNVGGAAARGGMEVGKWQRVPFQGFADENLCEEMRLL